MSIIKNPDDNDTHVLPFDYDFETEIIYESGSGLSNFYGHLSIAIGGIVFSYAPYGRGNILFNISGDGIIMIADKMRYIQHRTTNEKRTAIVFTLNYTVEQTAGLLSVFAGYVDTSAQYDKTSTFGAMYFFGGTEDGLDRYHAVFGMQCVDFVLKGINTNIENLKIEQKSAPTKISPFTHIPFSVRDALNYDYALKRGNGMVKSRTLYK